MSKITRAPSGSTSVYIPFLSDGLKSGDILIAADVNYDIFYFGVYDGNENFSKKFSSITTGINMLSNNKVQVTTTTTNCGGTIYGILIPGPNHN